MPDSSKQGFTKDLERIKFAMNAAGIGVWEVDIANNKLIWDDRCSELVGLEKQYILPYNEAFQYVYPEDLARVGESINAALKGENDGLFDATYRTLGADQLLRWVNFTGTAYFDEAGQVIRFGGIARDVTDSQIAQEKITKSQQDVLSLFEQSSVALATIARENLTFTSANTFYGELVGRSPEVLIGQPFLKVLPELQQDGFDELLNGVLNTGIPFVAEEVPVKLVRAGKLEISYLNFAYQPMRDLSGQVTAVLVVATDITPQVVSRKKIEEGEGFLELLSNSVPAMIFYLNAEEQYTSYNETFRQWYNVDARDAIGIRARDFIGEKAYTRIKPHLTKAFAGAQVRFEMPAPSRIGPDKWLSIVYTPDKIEDGTVKGIIVHATDVTESKRTELALRESEARFRSVFEQAPMGIALMEGRDMVITLGNERIFEIWGKSATVAGLPVMQALPELEGQPFLTLMEGVYDTGIPHFGIGTLARLVRNGILEDAYFDFVYTPIRNAEGKVTGIMTLATEVTKRELANQAVFRSEARFRSLIEEAPVATCLFTGRELKIEVANESMIRLWGKDNSVMGKRLEDAVPELKGQPFLKILDDVYTTGIPFSSTAARAELEVDGVLGSYYFNFTYKPVFNEAGEVYGIIDMAVDVTDQVLATQALEEKEAVLRDAIELAELGTWSIDIPTGKVSYSERLQYWIGQDEAVLDTASSPRVHPKDRERVKQALIKATEKGGSGRFDEIYTILNVVTGAERIIHSSGQALFDDEGNVLRLSGTAQDVTMQRDLQTALEQEVQTRTEELGATVEELQAINEELADANDQLLRSNEELEQYAYVASHDLQEPLRKILVYASMLKTKKDISNQNLDLIAKISSSAERMRQLILNLLDFSRLLESNSVHQPIDLNTVLKDVLRDFELVAEEKGARFEVGNLPQIEAVGLQMNQLFYNLISNSLKFTKTGVPPVITISAQALTRKEVKEHIRTPLPFATYYKIGIQDNGIGFEKQYFDQIFEIFKRLHARDSYPGSGIGLALCRRIMLNHSGTLYTESVYGEGATFFLILPDRQSEANLLV